jgi:hypothetical protein
MIDDEKICITKHLAIPKNCYHPFLQSSVASLDQVGPSDGREGPVLLQAAKICHSPLSQTQTPLQTDNKYSIHFWHTFRLEFKILICLQQTKTLTAKLYIHNYFYANMQLFFILEPMWFIN